MDLDQPQKTCFLAEKTARVLYQKRVCGWLHNGFMKSTQKFYGGVGLPHLLTYGQHNGSAWKIIF